MRGPGGKGVMMECGGDLREEGQEGCWDEVRR